MKPTEETCSIEWKNCLNRVEENRSFLHIHGFISDSENEKVRKRVLKWCEKNGVKVIEKSIFDD